MSEDKDYFQGRRVEMTDLSREDRERVRPLVGATLAAMLLGGLVLYAILYSPNAKAAEVFRSVDNAGGPAALKLHEKPCTNAKVREHLYDKLLDDRRFKAATLTYHGRDWASCWVDRQGVVHSMDEEGAPFQPVPRHLFKDDSV